MTVHGQLDAESFLCTFGDLIMNQKNNTKILASAILAVGGAVAMADSGSAEYTNYLGFIFGSILYGMGLTAFVMSALLDR